MKRILCIRLPDWPIQRLTLTRPELKGQAIVLHETRRGTERVAACSARATALGITVGMPLAEALALRGEGRGVRGEVRDEGRGARGEGRFADDKKLQIANCKLKIADSPHHSPLFPHHSPLTTHHFPYDPLADREALGALAEWSARFSPIVGLEDSAAPECLLLDVTGLAHLFGGEASLAERIVRDFARRGLTVRLAVADTLGGAWVITHSAFSTQRSALGLQHSSFILHPSSFIIHPSSFILIPPGGTLPALRPLPVAALRIAEETVELLRHLGIHRIGQLEALPREELSSRFGPQLLERWDQAVGRLAEPVPVHAQRPTFQAQWSPEHPIARREAVEAALEQLLGQVVRQLARLGRGAVRLECRLDCTSGDSAQAGSLQTAPVQVSVGLFRPSASVGHLASLARMQLERLRLPGPLLGLHVAATITAPLVEQQQELFLDGDGLSRRHARYLVDLIERLSSRLGRRSVLRVRLVWDAQPELSWRYEPLVDGSPTRHTRRGLGGRGRAERAPGSPVSGGPLRGTPATLPRKWPEAELPPRPLRLLRRPVALAVTSILPGGLSQFPRSENGTVPFPDEEAVPLRLLSFQFCGRSHRTANSWGPERIETGWWRNGTVGRDYYQIETTTGGRWWLFRRLRDGRWFLHGTFE